MKIRHTLLATAVLASLAGTANAEITIDMIGGSEVSFEGLVQADANWFNSDVADLGADSATVNGGDGADADYAIRRAELVMKGKGPGMWNWVVGYDAKDQKFLDANVQYRFSGFTTLTVGQFKQPNSLEELSSTKNNDFIAKAMNTNMQGVARRTGVQLSTGGDNWTAAASYFDRELTRNRAQGAGFGLRGAYAPILSEGNILHLGLSYVNYDCEDNADRPRCSLKVRPDADLAATELVNTGTFTDGDKIKTTGLEGAYVNGPVKVQAEYMTTSVTRTLNPDFTGDSWYVYGVYNLTGETWGYKNGTITTGLPNDTEKGMWQLAVRYDTADLNDGAVVGGKQSNLTVGVNWYLRSNFKLSANYVNVLDHEKGLIQDEPNIMELRAQYYW
jgi:phosphate-selective porin OprO/OprP